MRKNDQWMPLYIADYLADTQHLTAEQHGAYLLLLMQQWRSGALPLDVSELALMARIDLAGFRRRVWPKLLKFFDETATGFVQKRLAAERAHADDVSEKRAKSGRKGSASRWETDNRPGDEGEGIGSQSDGKCHGKGMANASQNDGQRARTRPSPSQDKKEPPTPSECGPLPNEAPDDPSPKAAPKRREQIPENWRPSERDLNFAACHVDAADLDREIAQFVDYHRGRGTVFRDFSRAWQTWCRNHSAWKSKRRPAQRAPSKLDWMLDDDTPRDATATITPEGFTLQ